MGDGLPRFGSSRLHLFRCTLLQIQWSADWGSNKRMVLWMMSSSSMSMCHFCLRCGVVILWSRTCVEIDSACLTDVVWVCMATSLSRSLDFSTVLLSALVISFIFAPFFLKRMGLLCVFQLCASVCIVFQSSSYLGCQELLCRTNLGNNEGSSRFVSNPLSSRKKWIKPHGAYSLLFDQLLLRLKLRMCSLLLVFDCWFLSIDFSFPINVHLLVRGVRSLWSRRLGCLTPVVKRHPFAVVLSPDILLSSFFFSLFCYWSHTLTAPSVALQSVIYFHCCRAVDIT